MKKYIYLVLLLVVLFFAVLWLKDVVISNKLTKIFTIPVKVSGVGIDFLDVFKNDNRKLNLAHLAIGEGPAQVNLQKITITEIRQNKLRPNYCLDGHAAFEKFYLGSQSHDSCYGGIDFACVPYAMKEGDELNILLQNGKFKLGESDLSLYATVKGAETTFLSLNGSLSRGQLNKALACLNSDTDEIITEARVPNFTTFVTFAENLDPITTLMASGNFILYEGRFRTLDLLDSTFKALQLSNDTDKKESKKFDEIKGNFLVKDLNVNINNIVMNSTFYTANGYGKVAFNGDIDFRLNLQSIVSRLPTKTLKLDLLLPKGLIPIKITGTTEKPKVAPNPRGLVNGLTPPLINETINQIDEALGGGLKNLFNL